MKIILDTNVFISGIFWSGPPYQILKAWQHRKIELIVSQEILNEYDHVSKALKVGRTIKMKENKFSLV